jgi:hypothetical protein
MSKIDLVVGIEWPEPFGISKYMFPVQVKSSRQFPASKWKTSYLGFTIEVLSLIVSEPTDTQCAGEPDEL